MTALVRPIPHWKWDDGCYGCSLGPSFNCGDVCAACSCRWELDDTGEPNPQAEWCESPCMCHEWALVDSRALVSTEDSLEAAWKEAGYTDSLQVYNAEGR